MKSIPRHRVLANILLAMSIFYGFATSAFATFINVTTTADQYNSGSSACSLRAALHAASARAVFAGCPAGNGSDTIFIPAGTYAISLPSVSGHPEQGGPFYIATQSGSVIALDGQGGAATTILDAQGFGPVLDIAPGANSNTLIVGLTFRGGVPGTVCSGSGINFDCFTNQTSPTLSVFDSWITGNTDAPAFYAEGGIVNLTRVSVTDNGGAGIYMDRTSEPAAFDDVTVSRNVSRDSDEAAGILLSQTTGTITISNSTIAYNGFSDSNPNDFDSTDAGGIAAINGSSTVYLRNTIIARNSRGDRSRGGDCAGVYVSQGYNLIGDSQNCFLSGVTTGNLVNVDPMLAPLFDYGHGLPTHMLLPGSPAIGAGNPATAGSGGTACQQYDGRDLDRSKYGACDIGAYQTHADFNVTSTLDVNDSNPGDGVCSAANVCTLRAAIDEANHATTFKTIRLPAGHFTVTRAPSVFVFPDNSNGAFSIVGNFPLTIVGAGAGKTIIDGGQLDRTFFIGSSSGAEPTVSFHELTITGGVDGSFTHCGGGILSAGDLLVDRASIVNNTAACGGGIDIQGLSNAVIDASTIAGNRTDDSQFAYGGGIFVNSKSSIDIVNSTIASNTSRDVGGGIAIASGATATLSFDTIADNHSALGGGGIANYLGGTYFAVASIIANNTDASGHAPDCSASLQVSDWILLRNETGCTIGGSASNLVIANQDPYLTSITLQGGSTPTIGVTAASPVFDYLQGAYECDDVMGVAILSDQRGSARPTDHYGAPAYGGFCDIGAYQGTSDVIFASNIDY